GSTHRTSRTTRGRPPRRTGTSRSRSATPVKTRASSANGRSPKNASAPSERSSRSAPDARILTGAAGDRQLDERDLNARRRELGPGDERIHVSCALLEGGQDERGIAARRRR